MSEIKRYAIICAYNEDGEPEALKMPDNTGEWVRWEDVQEYLKKHRYRFLTSDEMVSEIRKSAYEMLSKRMDLE